MWGDGNSYPAEHRRVRAAYAARMRAGEVFTCPRCGDPVTGSWHLDHTDDRAGYLGPAHAECNLLASYATAKRRRRAQLDKLERAHPVHPGLA